MKSYKMKLNCTIIVIAVLLFPTACSSKAYYETNLINSIEIDENIDAFYTQVNAKDNYKKIILKSITGNNSKEIFSIALNKQIWQRPSIKKINDNIILSFNNISYDEKEVFKDSKNGLYEQRMKTDSAVFKYSIKTNAIENITPKNQKDKLIFDVFENNDEIFTVFENGIYKNNTQVYSNSIIKKSPFRMKGVFYNNEYVFASINGIYSFNTKDNSSKCLLEKNYKMSDYVKIIKNSEFYYVINQEIKPYSSYFSKKTNVTIEKYNNLFSLI